MSIKTFAERLLVKDRIEYTYNRDVRIEFDKDFLYVNGNQFPTGLAGDGQVIKAIGYSGTTAWQDIPPLGDTGLQGATGLNGVTGAFGGPPGETGFAGATGVQGYTGLQGSIGDTGTIGLTGAQGHTGAQGYTGAQGITGIIGVTGLIGLTGAQGHTGAQGYTGVLMGVTGALHVIFDGGDSWLTTGFKADLVVPFKHTITEYWLLNDAAGSISVSLWRDSYANFPPTSADIIGTAVCSLANKSTATTSSWTATQLNPEDIVRLNIDSVTGLQLSSLTLKYKR